MLDQSFTDYYRCPPSFAQVGLSGALSGGAGFFRFGPDLTCYGESSASPQESVTGILYDVANEAKAEEGTIRLPFSPTKVIDNLRRELYTVNGYRGKPRLSSLRIARNAYYLIRPWLPVSVRRHLQRSALRGWDSASFPAWPVDRTVDRIYAKLLLLSLRAHSVEKIPFIWFWPDGSPSCTMMTHDIETQSGLEFCSQLMDMNDRVAVKSSFQVVPEERYKVSERFLSGVCARGFEVNIHDLNHDGRLFSHRERFVERANRINQYAREYGALGFRSAILYRNVDWFDALEVSYDMSVPNVAHLDPQPGGCCTVMPYFVGKLLELPLTTTQDYSLFHILGDYSLALWKQQVGLIIEQHGLISFNVHPDYIIEKRARETYVALLEYISHLRSDRKTWIALPNEVNRWWRQRHQMQLRLEAGAWRIHGEGSERARIAWATPSEDGLVYTIDQTS